jgi:CheY-like chemotaxis protein
MCLRLCESALRLNPAHKQALALWLAADFRREAQLGEGKDATRPEGFPAAIYFAQSAGAEYCQLALARAVKAVEPAVALGMIEALRTTAGPVSLLGEANQSSPLAEALAFPARLVRIRAALALALARPERQFNGYQNLMPVLAEALRLHAGVRDALVVDADEAVANAVAGALRSEGYQVVTSTSLLDGLQKVRTAAPGIDVIAIASNIADPGLDDGLRQLRGEFRFGATPVILITKPADGTKVRDLVRADISLGQIVPSATGPEIAAEVKRVSDALRAAPITPELGLSLAAEATEALHLLAVSKNPIFTPKEVESALLTAFTTKDADLRKAVAKVLGFLPSAQAQEAIAAVAFDTTADEALRVAMFTALAESAKRQGNLLKEDRVTQLVTFVQKDENMTLRTAASQALGALNLPATPASQIIRDHAGAK